VVIDLIIPVLNEEGSLPGLLTELNSKGLREIIVVDNGSTDQSASVAKALDAVVLHEPRRGYGYACSLGIRYCSEKTIPPDIIVFMDGDGSDRIEDLDFIVNPIQEHGFDFVVGSRITGNIEKGALTIPQQFGNRLACLLIRWMYGIRFTDLGPFRAIRLKPLLDMNLQEMRYGWTVEMQIKAARLKLRCTEVPIGYRKRLAGQSKVSGTLSGTILAGYRILLVVFRSYWNK